jgi:hypothetical protein
MLLFVAGYALGAGNIPWQQGELFRLEVRGVGTSICTAVNWYVLRSYLVFLLSPEMHKLISGPRISLLELHF